MQRTNLQLNRDGFPLLRHLKLTSVLPILLGGVALWIGLTTIFGTLTHSYPSLFWDQWDIYCSYFNYSNSGNFWDWLFLNHNGHRFVITRLLMLLDMTLNGGSNHLLIVLILANQLLILLTLCGIANKNLNTWQSKTIVISLGCILLFSATQLENFTWSLQLQFVNVFLFALLSFLLSDRFSAKGKWAYALGACGFALLSSFSMANGMLVWGLLGLQAMLHRRWSFALLNIVVFCLFVAFYFPHDSGAGFSISTLLGRLKLDGAFFKFLLIYIANPLGKKSFDLAYLFASLSILFFFALILFHLLKTGDKNRRFRRGGALLMTAAFVLLTGISTTLGRVDRGLINATSERYTTGALLLATCLLFYMALHWHTIRPRKILHVICIAWIATCGCYVWTILNFQNFYLFHYGIQYQNKMLALNGIRNGCIDSNYSGFLYPDLLRHKHTVLLLRENVHSASIHSLCADELVFSNDSAFESGFLKTAALSCRDLEGSPSKVILYGSVRQEKALLSHPIFLTDSHGHHMGSGYFIRSFQNEEPFRSFDPEQGNLLFYGHADRELIQAPFQLWIQKGTQLFKLGESRINSLQTVTFAALHPIENGANTACESRMIHADAAWTANGTYPGTATPDDVQHIWGSWSGTDENKGEIQFEIQLKKESRYLRLPYISGPVSPAAKISIRSRDGSSMFAEYLLPPSSETWTWVLIDTQTLPRTLVLEISENGDGWGQWIGIAEPCEE